MNQRTFSSSAATVTNLFPSIFFICVTPFPTTPKFSAEPTARTPASCGDHLIEVLAIFYLTPMEIP